MKKSFALTALACASLVLTACGSSGGSLSHPNPNRSSAVINNTAITNGSSNNANVQTNTNTNGSSNNATTNNDNSVVSTNWGYVYHGNRTDIISSHDIRPADINTFDASSLNIGGRSFDLTKANGESSDINQYVHSYTAMHHGWLHEKPTGQEYVFAQGQLTTPQNIPTNQTITYKGGVIYSCAMCGDALTLGTSQFEVNFADKMLSGTLSLPSMNRNLDVKGRIDTNGNKFEGVYQGTAINGGFFGDNAEEMGGVFRNYELQGAGSFGATKQ